jgi:hypothetical protein
MRAISSWMTSKVNEPQTVFAPFGGDCLREKPSQYCQKITAKTYTDAGLLPIWDAVLDLLFVSVFDSQMDAQTSVAGGHFPSTPVTEKEILESSGARINKGFRHGLSTMVNGGREVENGARCRVRTCRCGHVHQELTLGASPRLLSDADSGALVEVWTKMPIALKAAAIAIVRSFGSGAV